MNLAALCYGTSYRNCPILATPRARRTQCVSGSYVYYSNNDSRWLSERIATARLGAFTRALRIRNVLPTVITRQRQRRSFMMRLLRRASGATFDGSLRALARTRPRYSFCGPPKGYRAMLAHLRSAVTAESDSRFLSSTMGIVRSNGSMTCTLLITASETCILES